VGETRSLSPKEPSARATCCTPCVAAFGRTKKECACCARAARADVLVEGSRNAVRGGCRTVTWRVVRHGAMSYRQPIGKSRPSGLPRGKNRTAAPRTPSKAGLPRNGAMRALSRSDSKKTSVTGLTTLNGESYFVVLLRYSERHSASNCGKCKLLWSGSSGADFSIQHSRSAPSARSSNQALSFPQEIGRGRRHRIRGGLS